MVKYETYNKGFREILTKLDQILTELAIIRENKDLKTENTSLKVKIGTLSANNDILTSTNAGLINTLKVIEEYTRLARPDQNHLPHINELARKALEQ